MQLTRKEFIKLSGTAGIMGFVPFFSKANYKEREGVSIFSDQPQVTIDSVKAFLMPEKRALYVKVTSSEGISGWGEASHKYPEIILPMISELGNRIKGKSVWDTEYLWNYMFFKEVDAGQNGFLGGAMAGIDSALWDLKGKLLDIPVYSLLGGPYSDKIKVYGSFGRGTKNPLSTREMVEKAVDFVEKGYKALKVRMQIRQLNRDPQPDPSFEVVREVRKAIGDDIILFYDANNGYSPYRAIQVGRALYEKYNIATFEEPVAEHNYRGLGQVADGLEVPVTAGEHEYNKWQFRDLITIGKIDIINPDVAKCGGITEALKIAVLASAYDLRVMCHNTRPTLATTAACHFVMSIHNSADYQEFGGERSHYGLQNYFGRNLRYKAGYVEVPEGPGFGMEPDEKLIEKSKIN